MRKKAQNIEKRILKAALRIFAKYGYFKTTVDEIAKAAGFAKGTLYLYFKDKESLYVTLLDEHIKITIDLLTNVERSTKSATEKLAEILTTLMHYMKSIKGAYPLFSYDNIHLKGKTLKNLGAAILPELNEMVTIIGRIVQEGIDNGEFKDVDPDIAGSYFFNAIRTALFGSFLKPDLNVDADTVLELFFEGIKKRR
jgi:TetR/AcrR family fatty acid metabolism transcriptional regulator